MVQRPRSPKAKRKLPKLSIAKQQANDYGLIATSYHEAAHTIVGLAHLLLVEEVSVQDCQEGTTNYTGYHGYDANTDNLRRIIVMSELKMIYAGLVGEKMYYKDICGSGKFPMHLKNGSTIDTNMASKLIRRYKLASSGKATFKLKQEIRQDVEKFLVRHWEEVKIVAHALYKKRKLSFQELKYLLTRLPQNKDFWKEKFKTIKIIHDEESDLSMRMVRNLISTKSNR